jgi:CheY-like chemotaxis protein
MDAHRLRSRRQPVSPSAENGAKQPGEAKQPLPATFSDLKRSGRRALIVEGDPATARLCRDVLESSGFVVDAVDSGIAAVVAARDRLPELIVMDLQLRDVPGHEAIAWLRSNPALRLTPIILLSTAATDGTDVVAARPGASLRKPVSAIAMQRTVHEVLK